MLDGIICLSGKLFDRLDAPQTHGVKNLSEPLLFFLHNKGHVALNILNIYLETGILTIGICLFCTLVSGQKVHQEWLELFNWSIHVKMQRLYLFFFCKFVKSAFFASS